MKMNLLPEQTSQYRFAHIVRQIRTSTTTIEVNAARCSLQSRAGTRAIIFRPFSLRFPSAYNFWFQGKGAKG
jgi:hypothetical protein